MINFETYLVEVCLLSALVWAFYKLFLARLTFFSWNRWYILGGVVTAIMLPTLPFEFITTWGGLNEQQTFGAAWFVRQVPSSFAKTIAFHEIRLEEGNSIFSRRMALAFFGLYSIGLIHRLFQTIKSVWFVEKVRRSAEIIRVKKDCNIYRQSALSTFSFGRNIFLQEQTKSLTEKELNLILGHELAHVRHKHTWDVLFLEITQIVFWFSPFLYYLSQHLRDIHEYQADASIAGSGVEKMDYAKLLLKLAKEQSSTPILHSFSSSQVLSRIQMLTKPNSDAMQKLRFLGTLPLVVIIVLLSSCLGEDWKVRSEFHTHLPEDATFEAAGLKIGKISWEGNTKYRDEELSRVFAIKQGDAYDSVRVSDVLNGSASGHDVTSLYMDQGHLFFRIENELKVAGNTVDLKLKVFEGPTVKIGKVTFAGIKKLNAMELDKKIETKPGELFSRIKLIHSQRTLSEMGSFDPRHIEIRPVPFSGPERNEVDIEFLVKEI